MSLPITHYPVKLVLYEKKISLAQLFGTQHDIFGTFA